MSINYDQLSDIKKTLQKFPNAKFFKGKNPWDVPCQIALPCATQNELGEFDAQNLIKNGDL